MGFKVPASKASKGQNMFDFEIPGVGEFKIKKAKFLTIGETEDLESAGQSSTVIDTVFGKRGTKLGDAIRDLDGEQFQALMDAWTADSGVTTGESNNSES